MEREYPKSAPTSPILRRSVSFDEKAINSPLSSSSGSLSLDDSSGLSSIDLTGTIMSFHPVMLNNEILIVYADLSRNDNTDTSDLEFKLNCKRIVMRGLYMDMMDDVLDCCTIAEFYTKAGKDVPVMIKKMAVRQLEQKIKMLRC